MAEQGPNVDHIKQALVSSGVLKSAQISEADQKKIHAELAAKGVKAEAIFIVCSTAHYCIVIKKD